MTAKLIDGKRIAREVEIEVAKEIEYLASRGIRAGLVVVRVGDDPASEVYVRNKKKKALELGIAGQQKHFPATLAEEDLVAELDRLNRDENVDGILLQLPLPSHIRSKAMLERIDPAKDVDGFHPINVGRLHSGDRGLIPCTPAGVIRLIESTGSAIRGKRAVVIGRSDIVGKPVAALLLQRDATVTICHSKTADLGAVIREGEIVVAAIGRPLMITVEMIQPGAIVIDVGVSRITPSDRFADRLEEPKRRALEEKGSALVGDVDFRAVRDVASWITPVPGGVGPMTIAMLMRSTVQAARERRG
ncbi:MAG TPA: bifunctional methylenetetrahydrofolate dehydrogenase/methenyltetrahydrofolate cyclohydrolase FolD [Thermoanaerobaculia bacterium]